MNMRIYKKKAKRAREILTAEHGFRERDFDTIRKDDEAGYELFGHLTGSDPLKGTPVIFDRFFWSSEGELQCCINVLRECQYWDVSETALFRRYRMNQEKAA